jgi:hypothetical protein
MATTSNYPGAIDSLQSPAANLSGPPTHEDIHLEIADAVEKVEAEIGVNAAHRMLNAYASVAARDAAIASPVAGNMALTTISGKVWFQWYDATAWRSLSFVVGDPSQLWFLNEDDETVPLVSTKSETRLTGTGPSFAIAYSTAWPAGVTSVDVVANVYRGGLSTGTPIIISDLSATTSFVFVTAIEADGTAIAATDSWYCDFIATATY